MKQQLLVWRAKRNGELDHVKDLANGLGVYRFLTWVMWAFTAYNALMSFGFYLYHTQKLPGGPIGAGLFTVLIAGGVVVLGFYVVDWIADWMADRDMENRTPAMFFSALLLWIALQGWDVNVNFKGIDPAAEATTEMYRANQSSNVRSSYDAEIIELRAELLAVYHPYFWCGVHKKRHAHHDPAKTGNPNLASVQPHADVCEKEKFWFGHGKASGISASAHKKAKKKISGIEGDISHQKQLRDADVAIAQTEYSEDKGRYDTELADKRNTHSYMVIVSYFIILGCTVYCVQFSNKVKEYLTHGTINGKVPAKSTPKAKPVPAGVGSAGPSSTGEVITDPNDNTLGMSEVMAQLVEALKTTQTPPPPPVAPMVPKVEEAVPVPPPVAMGPPDNTGKSYAKKEGREKIATKKTSKTPKEYIAMLRAYKQANPGCTKAQAVEGLKGKMGKTTVYKYWENA